MAGTTILRGSMRLDELPRGAEAVIISVAAAGELALRLTELGYFPGERAKKVLVSPLGDPCAYLVRGTVTALRATDAGKIGVELEVSAGTERSGGPAWD